MSKNQLPVYLVQHESASAEYLIGPSLEFIVALKHSGTPFEFVGTVKESEAESLYLVLNTLLWGVSATELRRAYERGIFLAAYGTFSEGVRKHLNRHMTAVHKQVMQGNAVN